MIFGGYSLFGYKDQISIVESCKLTRLGNLPKTFEHGACETFKTSSGKEETLLCFAYSFYKICQR